MSGERFPMDLVRAGTEKERETGHTRDETLIYLAEKAPWRLTDLDDLVAGLLQMGYRHVLIRYGRIAGMYACEVEAGPEQTGEKWHVTQQAPSIREAVFRVGQRIGRHFAPNPSGAGEVTDQGDDAVTSDELVDAMATRLAAAEERLKAQSVWFERRGIRAAFQGFFKRWAWRW